MGEIGHAVVKQNLSLNQGEELVQALLQRYEHVFSQPGGNPSQRFDQVYDLVTLRPKAEWEALYQSVKDELKQLGLSALA
jgi:hypothetical protein